MKREEFGGLLEERDDIVLQNRTFRAFSFLEASRIRTCDVGAAREDLTFELRTGGYPINAHL